MKQTPTPRRRVVVTGIGVATGFGVGADVLIEGLQSGRSAYGPLEGRLAELGPGWGAQLDLPRKEFRNWFDPRVLRFSTMTRQTTLGCVACGDLLIRADAKPDGSVHPDRGAYLGSFIVPPDFVKQVRCVRILSHRPDGQDDGYVLDDTRLDEAMKFASAFDFLRALPNMPSSHLSIQTGHQGPTCTYLGSDASGLQAIVQAASAIEGGIADVMVAGGAFSPFQEAHLAWQGQRGLWVDRPADAAAAASAVAPYGVGRSGALPGEGAALLYLEERSHAVARGATILAELTGWGQRFVTPGEDDEVDVRADALRAAMPEGAPDWVAPTALAHPELDRLESEAWSQAFGAAGLAASGGVAPAARLGFTGPTTGALSLVVGLLAARGELTPVSPTRDIDPACAALGGTLGRVGRTGAGATLLGANFSIDGAHAALALRVEGTA